MTRTRWKLLCVLFTSAILYLTVIHHQKDIGLLRRPTVDLATLSKPLWNQTLDFDELPFNNVTGNPTGCYIVPNYIHYIYAGGSPITYIEIICVLSAFKNQKPEKIFFHYTDNSTFTGKYWEVLMQTPGFITIVTFSEVQVPENIFGQPLSEGWKLWHGSDILRSQILMRYGGVFLDNDIYLVQSIDNFRKYEISIGWDEGQFLGTQVIIAHKDARFLRLWLDSYREYDGTKWYYNAGEKPTAEVLYKKPYLVHRVKILFGVGSVYAINIFQKQWSDWKIFFSIHLLARHQYLFKSLSNDAKFPVTFNETNIGYYPIAFRDMAYDIYDIANINWPKNKF